MTDEELSQYSEDNFESMIESWHERDNAFDEMKRIVRWWVKFTAFVTGIVTFAFLCGYALARLS